MKLLNWSCQKIHCSVDDTLWIFKDLTEHKEYVSIFENPILNKIKELHLKFVAVFTCYCFFNAWYNFTLADATDRSNHRREGDGAESGRQHLLRQ